MFKCDIYLNEGLTSVPKEDDNERNMNQYQPINLTYSRENSRERVQFFLPMKGNDYKKAKSHMRILIVLSKINWANINRTCPIHFFSNEGHHPLPIRDTNAKAKIH